RREGRPEMGDGLMPLLQPGAWAVVKCAGAVPGQIAGAALAFSRLVPQADSNRENASGGRSGYQGIDGEKKRAAHLFTTCIPHSGQRPSAVAFWMPGPIWQSSCDAVMAPPPFLLSLWLQPPTAGARIAARE